MADCMFARYQLEKHGWTEGVGLGKHENGITKPIKVVKKNNKDGVGHIPGSDLTTNWWDQAYNKAASKILVKVTEDGTTFHKTETNEIKKNKSLLYARFVKGATLKSSEGRTIEEPEYSSESEKEEILPRLTDEEIFKICGGRTAHKSAKHGLKQNGKLQRIQEQERQYLESLNKKSESSSETKRGKEDEKVVEESVLSKVEEEKETESSQEEELHGKKRKRDAKDKRTLLGAGESSELSVLTKKGKKKKCKEEKEQNEKEENTNGVIENGKMKSKKKKKGVMQEDGIENLVYSKKKRRQYLEEDVEKESQEMCEERKEAFSVTKKRKKNKLVADEGLESVGKKMRKCQTEEKPEMECTKEEEKSRKKEKRKERKRKKEKGVEEKSFLENEQLDAGEHQPDKLRNEIQRRINEEETIKASPKKKVVFSPELFTVYTFTPEENETINISKKKKKKKKRHN